MAPPPGRSSSSSSWTGSSRTRTRRRGTWCRATAAARSASYRGNPRGRSSSVRAPDPRSRTPFPSCKFLFCLFCHQTRYSLFTLLPQSVMVASVTVLPLGAKTFPSWLQGTSVNSTIEIRVYDFMHNLRTVLHHGHGPSVNSVFLFLLNNKRHLGWSQEQKFEVSGKGNAFCWCLSFSRVHGVRRSCGAEQFLVQVTTWPNDSGVQSVVFWWKSIQFHFCLLLSKQLGLLKCPILWHLFRRCRVSGTS